MIIHALQTLGVLCNADANKQFFQVLNKMGWARYITKVLIMEHQFVLNCIFIDVQLLFRALHVY